ncbi:MAG: GntR family transcriptional regulator [Marinibacterium sp.]
MPAKMDQPTALPLYLQIGESLMRDIAAGRLADGERLPPERALAGEFGTTVRTLRKALAELADQGLLERVQGSGNYVRGSGTVAGIYSMFRLELPGGGGLPTARVLDVTETAKPAGLPAFGTSALATQIRRLRFLDDEPVAVEQIWLDRDCGTLTRAEAADSLYRTYRQKLGLWINRIQDRVSVGPVPDWAPADLGLAPGALAGFVARTGWAQSGEPVEMSHTWFHPARAQYVHRMK